MKKLIDIKQYSDSIFHCHVFLMRYLEEKDFWESCFEEKIGYKIWYPIWYPIWYQIWYQIGYQMYNASWKRLRPSFIASITLCIVWYFTELYCENYDLIWYGMTALLRTCAWSQTILPVWITRGTDGYTGSPTDTEASRKWCYAPRQFADNYFPWER